MLAKDSQGNVHPTIATTQLQTSVGSLKKQENFRKIPTSALLTTLVDCVDNNKRWKILKKMGIPDDLTAS